MTIIVSAKEAGYTNKSILKIDFFKNLFDEVYLNNCSDLQLEWRLKNMARDLKKISFENLELSWHDYKVYFEGTRRKIKNDDKATISM